MLNPQILLAMDDVSEGQKISHWLNSCGFQALIFNMWDKEGSFRFENIKPDIILMDIFYMGHTNEMNILEKIKGDLDIPLVYLTSDFFDYHDELPILNNNYEFLVRPIDPRLLRLTMEMVLYTHRMKNSLRNSEQKYRLLIENVGDPIVVVSYSGNFLLVNHSAANFFGLKREDFLGKSIWDIFDNKYANRHIKNIRGVIETGKGKIIEEKTIIHGKEFWFSTNIQPMPMNEEKRAVQLIVSDITPQKNTESSLKKSEEKFRVLFNNANDAIFLLSFKKELPEISEVNDLACRQLGYTRDELLKMSLEDIISKDTVEKMPKNLNNIKSEEKATFESILTNSNGDKIPVEISNHLFKLQGEEMVLSIARDISDRKQYEKKLLRISTAIEGTSDAIGISMPDGTHFYHNQAFTNLFGYSVEELKYPLGPVKLYSDIDIGRSVFETIMNGNGWDGEVEMVDKNKRHFPVQLRANAIKNERNEVIGLIGVHTDIKDRKMVESALKESEEKFRTLAQSAVDAIIITNHLDRIVFCNRSMERIFEYENKQILGQYIDTLIPRRHTEEFQNRIERYLHKNEMGNVFEFYGLRKDGSEFPIEISLNTWEAADELYTTFIIRDITLRKLNEFKFKMREEIFQLMAKNMEEVFWNIDPLTGQILYMSPSFHKIWGYSVDKLYQNPRSWLESILYEDKDKFVAYIFGKPGSGQSMKDLKCRIVRPDGEVRWISVRAFPVINQNKEIYRIIGLAKDITTIKKLEMKNKEIKLSRDF
jgi:two-component system, sporulation sensor kinase E